MRAGDGVLRWNHLKSGLQRPWYEMSRGPEVWSFLSPQGGCGDPGPPVPHQMIWEEFRNEAQSKLPFTDLRQFKMQSKPVSENKQKRPCTLSRRCRVNRLTVWPVPAADLLTAKPAAEEVRSAPGSCGSPASQAAQPRPVRARSAGMGAGRGAWTPRRLDGSRRARKGQH